MFDSDQPAAIPASAAVVAGYVTGPGAWTTAQWSRWPADRHVAISRTAGYFVAHVLDVEAGAAQPEQVPGWIIRAGPASGFVPTIYGSRSTLDRCKVLVAQAGNDCDWWLADPTGIPHLPAGYSACQYAWPGRGSPAHFDLSVVADGWPRKIVPPKPVQGVTPRTDGGEWIPLNFWKPSPKRW